MKGRLIAAMACVLLAACPDSYQQINATKLPPELADCKLYDVVAQGRTLYIVRCPLAATTTTYRAGKISHSVATIDGGQGQ